MNGQLREEAGNCRPKFKGHRQIARAAVLDVPERITDVD